MAGRFSFFSVPLSTARILRRFDHEVDATPRLTDEAMARLCKSRVIKTFGDSLRPLHLSERGLVGHNLRLVRSLARHFRNDKVIPFPDLIQEGTIGLIRAAESWNPARGSFSKFANKCIRVSLMAAVGSAYVDRGIRIPTSHSARRYDVLRYQRELAQKLRREPTMVEIAMRSEMDVDEVELALGGIPRAQSERTTMRFRSATVFDNGLAEEVGSDQNNHLINTLVDEDAVPIDEQAERQQHLRMLVKAFDKVLSERQRFVLTWRYGLESGEFMTLSEVGKLMGLVGGERVRQIEREALIRLRDQCFGSLRICNEPLTADD